MIFGYFRGVLVHLVRVIELLPRARAFYRSVPAMRYILRSR